MIRKFIDYTPLTALEIDEINRNTPDLTPEELEINKLFGEEDLR